MAIFGPIAGFPIASPALEAAAELAVALYPISQANVYRDRTSPVLGRAVTSNYPWYFDLDHNFAIPLPQLNTFRDRDAPARGRPHLSNYPWYFELDFDFTIPDPQLNVWRYRDGPERGRVFVSNYPWYYELDHDFAIPDPQLNYWRDRSPAHPGTPFTSNYPWYFELDFDFTIPDPQLNTWRYRDRPAEGRASVSNYPWYFDVDHNFAIPLPQLNVWRDRAPAHPGTPHLSNYPWYFDIDHNFAIPDPQFNTWRFRDAPERGRAEEKDVAWKEDPDGSLSAVVFVSRSLEDRGKPLPPRGEAREQQPWFEVVPWPFLHGVEAPSTVPPAGRPGPGGAFFAFADLAAGFGVLPPGPLTQDVRPIVRRERGRARQAETLEAVQLVDEFYAAVNTAPMPRRCRADAARRAGYAFGAREWTLDSLLVGWFAGTARPQGTAIRGRAEASQAAQPEQAAEPLWFCQEARRPVQMVQPTRWVEAAPPWHATVAIVVAGPWRAFAVQVSPAAGAVDGEARAAGGE